MSAMAIYPIFEAVCKNIQQVRSFLWIMQRALVVFLMLTMACGNVACSHRNTLRKEASLRESLAVLRAEIKQFTLDRRRPPTALAELVAGGYLKSIPTDPFTKHNDTWKVESTPDALHVHSGSTDVGSDGARYSSW